MQIVAFVPNGLNGVNINSSMQIVAFVPNGLNGVNTNSMMQTVAFVMSFCVVYLVKTQSQLISSNAT